MSGPKTSRYTLTPEQRRIFAEQRKIERRKAVASEKIKRIKRNSCKLVVCSVLKSKLLLNSLQELGMIMASLALD